MGLIERLAAPPTKYRPGRSVMDVWLESRPEGEQTVILNAVANPEWGHVALLKELVSEGAPDMSDTAFRAWRRRQGLA
jgi:hypothetical protein